MKKGKHLFESGHPDEEPRVSSGVHQLQGGALGALEKELSSGSFDFSCERQNQTTEQMLKSISIKSCDGDISKRWHVEYREFNPETSKWERRREYGFVNKQKDPIKRMQMLQDLAAEIMSGIVTRVTNVRTGENEIQKYIIRYIDDKRNTLRGTSIKNIKLALRYFYAFLKESKYHDFPINAIKRHHIHEFRMYLSKFTGNRSVNGHLSFVKSFFNYYIENFDNVLVKNPCAGIKKLPQVSETHVAYSDLQVKKYFDYMAEKDPWLLLYCKFIGLGFVRCEETRHLKIADIDFQRRTITLAAGYAKTRHRVRKPLLDVFYEMLYDSKIYNFPADFYVFSANGGPGQKQVGKNYFRKRFKKLKDEFGLDRKYTIYGFRHTFVSQLLDNGAKWHKVMQFTGHTTMEAFAHYARSLKVKPSEDLSRYLNI